MGDQLEGNIGPLTTTFTPPTTCMSTTTYVPDEFGFFHVAGAFTIDNYECYPSGTLQITGSTDLINMHAPYYYSPGICPSGWEPVISLESDFQKSTITQSTDSIAAGTTAWLCCPSGYTPDYQASAWLWYYTQNCVKTIKPGETMKNLWIATDSRNDVADVEATSTLSVQANGIPIFWQSTDRAVLEWWETASPAQTSSSPTTTSLSRRVRPPFATVSNDGSERETTSDSIESETSGGGRLPLTTGSQTNADPPQDTATAGGLSTGTKAGIGVGAGAGAILLGVLVYFALRLRKTRAEMRAMQEQLQGAGPHEVEYNPAGLIVEKQTSANVPEMATRANIAELPAVWRNDRNI